MNPKPIRLIPTGVTGFAGNGELLRALGDRHVERMTVLTRRPMAQQHPKLKRALVADFTDYAGVATTFETLANTRSVIACGVK